MFLGIPGRILRILIHVLKPSSSRLFLLHSLILIQHSLSSRIHVISNFSRKTLHRQIIGAAGDTKLLNQKAIDKLALGILSLLNSQELG